MHGGVADSRFFEKNLEPLAKRFLVFTPDTRAHGRTPDVEGPLTSELLADDAIAFVEGVVGGPAHLVGHSQGAYVALLTAIRRPDLVDRLVLVSGGFHRDGLLPIGGEFDVDQVVQFMGPAYGEVSPEGPEHFRVVVEKVAAMEQTEPNLAQSELSQVESRTLLMFGDDDLVTVEHMNDTYEGIPNSELAIVPGTSHFLLQEKPELCNELIIGFLTTEPVATTAPIRRAVEEAPGAA
jgi:pimeloyl-ACP methyl ester carboxylesterase